MTLEVIATSVTDAKLAARHGADRIELLTGILEGGLTPSYGLIEESVRSVQIPIRVMVRPHSRSFCYSREDIQTMVRDIQMIKQLGAAGIVVGTLTAEHDIDLSALQYILKEAEGLSVTFHRAFDEINHQEQALQTLAQFPQIKTILTSGGKKNVLDATEQMRRLVHVSADTHLSIMAGSGLNIPALPSFVHATGVREFHFGKAVRLSNQPLELIDPAKVSQIKRTIKSETGG